MYIDCLRVHINWSMKGAGNLIIHDNYVLNFSTACSHDNPAVALRPPYRQLHWAYLVFVNVWLLLNPSFLCADWTMGTIPSITTVTDPRNFLTMATFATIFILGWIALTRNGRNAKIVLFSLSLLVFPYVPASNLFFPVGFVVAERVLYLPSMGLCLLAGHGVSILSKRSPTLTKSLLTFILLTHSVKTFVRNADWESDTTLFVSAIRTNPGNGKVYNNLGHEYEHVSELERAEWLFQTASQVQSDDIGAYINLGRVLKAQKKFQSAEKVSHLLAPEINIGGKAICSFSQNKCL